MDSLKKEIQELSKEVLEIKKTGKEENINIRILSKELEILGGKIAQAKEEKENIPNMIKTFKEISEAFNIKNKSAKKKAFALVGVLAGGAMIFTIWPLNIIAGIWLTTTAGLASSLLFDFHKMDRIKKLKRAYIEIVAKTNIDEKNINEEYMKEFAYQRTFFLNEEIDNMNKVYRNKEQELNQIKEKRQNKEATYCNLTDKIKKLTEERINLSNMLLEEHENSTGEKRMSKSLFGSKKPQ